MDNRFTILAPHFNVAASLISVGARQNAARIAIGLSRDGSGNINPRAVLCGLSTLWNADTRLAIGRHFRDYRRTRVPFARFTIATRSRYASYNRVLALDDAFG